MSEQHFYEAQSPHIRLRIWVLGQMIWGAFIAGILLLGLAAILGAIWVVGEFLPAQSKEAPSPYVLLEPAHIVDHA